MGLASKMAAAQVQGVQQTAAPAYPPPNQPTYAGQQPPGPGQQYNPRESSQAQQHQYMAYQPPAQQQYGGQQQQQPPQQYGGQQQYQQPPAYGYGGRAQPAELPGAPSKPNMARDPGILFSILDETVRENKLERFYNEATLRQLAANIGREDPVSTICARWSIPLEIAFDLVKLALYDIVFLIDDSGSIEFSQLQGELRSLLKSAAFASSLFDQDGFSVRFLNSSITGDNIRTETQAENLVNKVRFAGVTPLVTALREKILRKQLGEVHDPTPNIRKPLLVIIITDGQPTDNPGREFQRLIKEYKAKPVAFQIAQVGTDVEAQNFLAALDSDLEVGSMIDCTSNFEMESNEFQKIAKVPLTRELWYTKLLLGSIDSSYDKKDETGNQPPALPAKTAYGAPPQQQYGGQQSYQSPQQGYPPPSQQYGQPQQQFPPLQQQYQQNLQPAGSFGQQYPSSGHSPAQSPQPVQVYGGYPSSPQQQQAGYGGQQQQYPPQRGYAAPPQTPTYGQPLPPPPQQQQQQQPNKPYQGPPPPSQYAPPNQFQGGSNCS